MSYYRLYFLDAQAKHIKGFDEFEAASDAEAIARADSQGARAPCELWCGRKRLHRVESAVTG
ncbi:MAG: hypothetical protein JO276_02415 [Sphingomonadaceae bacterium]|nr:hypothetical protein [Sphingomonadaceae bacterium]